MVFHLQQDNPDTALDPDDYDEEEEEDVDDRVDQNKPGMVARLMEMKRKRQHIANGKLKF